MLVRTMVSGSSEQMGKVYGYQPDRNQLADIMSEALTYRTISRGRSKPVSAEALLAFHDFLQRSFPLVHRHLRWERVNKYSLLYTWEGSSKDKKPVILLGHMDVVPIIPGTEDEWKHSPFAGHVIDGYVWGRGALDNKVNVIGILQATEDMLSAGIRPERTIYFGFGHDEEQGGVQGAKQIARLLESRGVEAEFLIDEGGLITSGLIPGIEVPMAIISPAEKGFLNLKLRTRGKGGHSSMPPDQTSIGVLAAAIAKLEANQFPRDFTHTKSFFEATADELPFFRRFVMKNLWLLAPLVMAGMENNIQAQAGMRTTIAATVIDGGVKPNVLPIKAEAVVNFRILPGETPEGVRQRVIDVIKDDRISVDYHDGIEAGLAPSPVSPTEGFAWEQILAAIRDTAAPERILVTPRLLVAATDTRHYRSLTPNHYRFVYMRVAPEDLSSIHGTNERISLTALADAVRFYHRLMSDL